MYYLVLELVEGQHWGKLNEVVLIPYIFYISLSKPGHVMSASFCNAFLGKRHTLTPEQDSVLLKRVQGFQVTVVDPESVVSPGLRHVLTAFCTAFFAEGLTV